MVLEGISSPHRRAQTPFTSTSPKKPLPPREELGSWTTLLQRHRFLIIMMIVLFFLCIIYLYFAVTLGGKGMCSELTGTEKAVCRLEEAKASMSKGKLKFL